MDATSEAQNRTPDELAQSLAPDASDLLRRRLAVWVSDSPKFKDFCIHHFNKIHSKFLGAKDGEDKQDILVELETASRFLAAPGFDVKYEPYVGGGPDLHVCTPFGDFDTEVKRIRETPGMTQLENCIHLIISAVRSVPSSLVFSLGFSPRCQVSIATFRREARTSLGVR
jgi:hypothetical protein